MAFNVTIANNLAMSKRWKKAKNKGNSIEEEEEEIKQFMAQLEDTKLFGF